MSTPRKITVLWNEYLRLKGLDGGEQSDTQKESGDMVYRDGKPYQKVNPENAAWLYK